MEDFGMDVRAEETFFIKGFCHLTPEDRFHLEGYGTLERIARDRHLITVDRVQVAEFIEWTHRHHIHVVERF